MTKSNSARVQGTPSSASIKSDEETNLLHRSKKKLNADIGVENNEIISNDPSKQIPESMPSYKDKLINLFGEDVHAKLSNSILEESSALSSQKIVSVPVGAGIEIPLTDEEWEQWSAPWRKTVVVKLLGKKVNFKLLEANLKKKWTKKGSVTIVDMANEYFLVHFSACEDYNHALFEGPWLVADHYLIVHRWEPMFLQHAEISKKIAVWIRIPRLPLELYNARFLWRIGSSLGTMLKIDKLTSIHSRGQFAHICVEMDLEKPLVPFIMIRGHKILLEYEGLHSICFNCGRYGHKADQCPEERVSKTEKVKEMVSETEKGTPTENPDVAMDITQAEVDNAETKDEFGSWMVVKRNQRKKGQGKSSKNQYQSARKPIAEEKKASKETIDFSKNENSGVQTGIPDKGPEGSPTASPVKPSSSIPAGQDTTSFMNVASFSETTKSIDNPGNSSVNVKGVVASIEKISIQSSDSAKSNQKPLRVRNPFGGKNPQTVNKGKGVKVIQNSLKKVKGVSFAESSSVNVKSKNSAIDFDSTVNKGDASELKVSESSDVVNKHHNYSNVVFTFLDPKNLEVKDQEVMDISSDVQKVTFSVIQGAESPKPPTPPNE